MKSINHQTATQTAPIVGLTQFINLDQIDLSPTNPRTRFNQTELDELAADIASNGVLQNLIVRPSPDSADRYELVAGERRHRSAFAAGLTAVPVVVRELSNDAALDIQIAENLHRKDISPLDEAAAYERLRNILDCSTAELAARVGKNEDYVAGRLRLNSLTEAFKKAFDEDFINLVMISEVAKYPADAQDQIFERAFDSDETGEITDANFDTLREMKNYITQNVLLNLESAPFSVKAKNLRPDGLACVNCPERTGAERQLFDLVSNKSDCCLNKSCYEGKIEQFVVIRRENVAATANREIKREIKAAAKTENLSKEQVAAQIAERLVTIENVPLISWYGSYSQTPESALRDGQYKAIYDFTPRCASIETGVYINGYGKVGQYREICRNAGCEIHWRTSSPSATITIKWRKVAGMRNYSTSRSEKTCGKRFLQSP